MQFCTCAIHTTQVLGRLFAPSQKSKKLSHQFRVCFELGIGILNAPRKIFLVVYVSWNSLGELQKLLPPFVSTFDIWLTDSKFRKFPPFLFHPPQQDHLAETQLSSARHDLNKNWANPPKYWDLFVDVSANSRTAWGSRLRRWSILWNNLKADTQLK